MKGALQRNYFFVKKGVNMDKKEMDTLKDIVNVSCIENKDKVAFIERNEKTKELIKIKYSKLREDINSLGTVMLKELNLKDKKVAVIGENSYKWVVTYMAVSCGVGVIVPLDKELPSNEIQNLLERSEASCVVYSSRKKELIEKIKDNLPKDMVYIEMSKEKSDDMSHSFDELVDNGKKLIENGEFEYINTKIDRNEFKILLFTSGTTAAAKGVMLCHKNLCFDTYNTLKICPSISDETFLSVLPMHHTYEFTITYLIAMYSGATVAICEGIKYIVRDIKEIRPSVITLVPAIIERIDVKIKKAIKDSGKEKASKVARNIANILSKVGIDVKRKLFKQVHETLGGNLKYIFCGAAPLDKKIMQDMEALGFDFLYGYGLTETAPLIASTNFQNKAFGTVGKPIDGVEVRIDLSKNKDENSNVGEIIVKGDNVFLGYYQNEEETKKVLKDGWFYTGDIGYFDIRGNLVISGRDKNVIVTSNGKNIFPEEIETLINNIPYVKESMVYAKKDPKRNDELVVAVKVTIDEEELESRFVTRPDSKDMYNYIWGEIKKINRTLVPYKAVKKLEIKTDDFVKTTTMKIKRAEELKKDSN